LVFLRLIIIPRHSSHLLWRNNKSTWINIFSHGCIHWCYNFICLWCNFCISLIIFDIASNGLCIIFWLVIRLNWSSLRLIRSTASLLKGNWYRFAKLIILRILLLRIVHLIWCNLFLDFFGFFKFTDHYFLLELVKRSIVIYYLSFNPDLAKSVSPSRRMDYIHSIHLRLC
jgi:hypothetical protein